ncbi:hypothetical protein SDJN02_13363, partial [Cucurbita argyrosperma subsp. argyrosperma]
MSGRAESNEMMMMQGLMNPSPEKNGVRVNVIWQPTNQPTNHVSGKNSAMPNIWRYKKELPMRFPDKLTDLRPDRCEIVDWVLHVGVCELQFALEFAGRKYLNHCQPRPRQLKDRVLVEVSSPTHPLFLGKKMILLKMQPTGFVAISQKLQYTHSPDPDHRCCCFRGILLIQVIPLYSSPLLCSARDCQSNTHLAGFYGSTGTTSTTISCFWKVESGLKNASSTSLYQHCEESLQTLDCPDQHSSSFRLPILAVFRKTETLEEATDEEIRRSKSEGFRLIELSRSSSPSYAGSTAPPATELS